MNDCNSGRSNNSGNLFMQGRIGFGSGNYENIYRYELNKLIENNEMIL